MPGNHALLQLLPSMTNRELLDDAQSIDLTSASTVTMQYAGRLEVKMKLSSDFDYQMRVLSKVMKEYVLYPRPGIAKKREEYTPSK